MSTGSNNIGNIVMQNANTSWGTVTGSTTWNPGNVFVVPNNHSLEHDWGVYGIGIDPAYPAGDWTGVTVTPINPGYETKEEQPKKEMKIITEDILDCKRAIKLEED